MMKLKTVTTVVLGYLSLCVIIHGRDNLKAFPPAGEGMARYVLQLPKVEDESKMVGADDKSADRAAIAEGEVCRI